MRPKPAFTLCFLLHGDNVLMLHRRFPPNQGLWNGVGGHIETGETPRQAIIREVAEETGHQIADPRFAGLLTWDGFEISAGGIYIFTAQVSHPEFVTNHEGDLAWKPRQWVYSSPEVVDNIHVFLPIILEENRILHYHFSYQDGVRVRDDVQELPKGFVLDMPFYPEEDTWEESRGAYLLSLDKARLQLNVVEDFLARRSYWAGGRSMDCIMQSIQNSVCIGIYHQGKQVAFARLVTDRATFAWLCDVYVDDSRRGQGLGKWLVEGACKFVDSCGIRRTMLATRDAHGLYQSYGDFKPLTTPEKFLYRDCSDGKKDAEKDCVCCQ